MKRRTMLTGLAAASSLLANRLGHTDDQAPIQRCRLVTRDVIGPYFVQGLHERSDIAPGQPGVPLTLEFTVLNQEADCVPLPGAIVSIWHCNAKGVYSGVLNVQGASYDAEKYGALELDQRGQNFLRGAQRADADGRVRFQTVFPGWYWHRPTHLHVSIYPPTPGEEATTQLYFAPEDCDAIYRHPAYAVRGPNPDRTAPGELDHIAGGDDGTLWVALQADGAGFRARHEFAVTHYGDAFGSLDGLYRQPPFAKD